MKPTTPARMYNTKLRAGYESSEKRKEKKISICEHQPPKYSEKPIGRVRSCLKSDENGAGTDGEGNYSHERTHDEVWMKDLTLQRDGEGLTTEHENTLKCATRISQA